MLGTHGAGTLVGMVLSGIKPHLRVGSLGLTLLLVDGVIGLLFVPMGRISATWQGAALMGVIGLLALSTTQIRQLTDVRPVTNSTH